MKTKLFIFLFLCLFFQACKAKTDNKPIQKKSPDKITAAGLSHKKADDRVASQADKSDITGKAAGQTGETNIVDKADTANQNEDLKAWKESVSKNLKPVPLKTKTVPTVSIPAKKEKLSAKNIHKKEMTTANSNRKMKIAETAGKLDLSKENNFGKVQTVDRQSPE